MSGRGGGTIAKRCGAKARSRNGEPCRQPAVTGSERCHYHGGKSTGRPAESYLYRRHLSPEGKKAFDAADPGSIDYEIRLAKANLDDFVAKHQEQLRADPTSGVRPGSGRDRLLADILRQHLETVRRLLEARARMVQGGDDGDARGAIRRLMDRIESGDFEPGQEL